MPRKRAKPHRPRAPVDFIEWARRLEEMLRAFDAKKAEVDRALAEGVAGAEANALQDDLDDADNRLVQELKAWNRDEAKAAAADASKHSVSLHSVDFRSILVMAEPLLARARLLADWVQDDPFDMTGAEMIANVALEWIVFEIALTAQGIGRSPAKWSAGNDASNLCEAAHCLHDLVHAVRQDADWFVYLPIFGDELIDLAPGARMGMPPSAFAKRLSVAVELLRGLKAPEPGKGKPGRRGYPAEVLTYAQELRKKHPDMKAHVIRRKCLEKFPEEDMPADAAAFRTWLNRRRTNRTN